MTGDIVSRPDRVICYIFQVDNFKHSFYFSEFLKLVLVVCFPLVVVTHAFQRNGLRHYSLSELLRVVALKQPPQKGYFSLNLRQDYF